MDVLPTRGEIITFYSYKGGTGRSMGLANVACLLAGRPESPKILVVDWDLEAPGLHRYFANRMERTFGAASESSKELELHPGLIDLFDHLRERIEAMPVMAEAPSQEIQDRIKEGITLDNYLISTDIRGISLMKAGRFDDEYPRRVNTFPWEALYQRAPWLISLLADWLVSLFDYILIDSRTGVTDTSGICTMLLPDKLVVVFTPNTQSLDGILKMILRATNYRRRSSDLRPLGVFPLPSRIEGSEPTERTRWRKDPAFGYQPRFEKLFREIWALDECDLETYMDEVQIQHVSAYAYGEKIAALLETDDRTGMRRSFTVFADRLIAMGDPWEQPETQPDAGADEFARRAGLIVAALKPAEQEGARILFLQMLRVPEGSTARPIPREVEFAVLPEDARSVADKFISEKLITLQTDPKSGRQTARIANESLLAWSQLQEWIQNDHEFLAWRDTLDAAISSWLRANQETEALLSGTQLNEAERWRAQKAAELNRSEQSYIAASRELQMQRKKASTRLKSSFAGGVILAALAFAYMVHSNSAEEQKKAANSSLAASLNAASLTVANEQPSALETSILLAVAAENLFPSPDAELRLRTGLALMGTRVATYTRKGSANAVAISPNGTYMATGYDDGTVAYLTVPNATLSRLMKLSGFVHGVSYSPDNQWLVAGGAGKAEPRILLLNRQKLVEQVFTSVGNVNSIAFSPDGHYVATGTDRGSVRVLSFPGWNLLQTFHNKAPLRSVAFTADSQSILSCDDLYTQLLPLNGGPAVPLQTFVPGVAAAISPDGKYFATGGTNGVTEARTANWSPVFSLTDKINSLAFSPDSKYLAIGGSEGVARLLDATTGTEITRFIPKGSLFSVEIQTGTQPVVINPRIILKPAINSVAFSPKSEYLATASEDGATIIWKARNDRNLAAMTGPELVKAACATVTRNLSPAESVKYFGDHTYQKTCPNLP